VKAVLLAEANRLAAPIVTMRFRPHHIGAEMLRQSGRARHKADRLRNALLRGVPGLRILV
jgi:hypothetical protein